MCADDQRLVFRPRVAAAETAQPRSCIRRQRAGGSRHPLRRLRVAVCEAARPGNRRRNARPACPPRGPRICRPPGGLHSPQPGRPESIPARPGKPRWLQRRAPVGESPGRTRSRQRQAAGVAGTRGGSLHIYSKRVPKLNVVYPDSGQVSKYSAATGHFSAARPSTRGRILVTLEDSLPGGWERDGSGCPRVNVFFQRRAVSAASPCWEPARQGHGGIVAGDFNEFEANSAVGK